MTEDNGHGMIGVEIVLFKRKHLVKKELLTMRAKKQQRDCQ
jgi:hypothetical protein